VYRSKSRFYNDLNLEITMIPRFTLTSAAIPKLRKRQESAVYQALTPHDQTHSLEALVERCCAHGYKRLMKGNPAQSDVWASVLWHLKRLKEVGVVREE
jgi:hypothetical protein